MKTFKIMLKTELKLSLRGMDMFIFAICAPIIVLVLIGTYYGNQPAFAEADFSFLQQSFGAMSAISICAGGVMGLPLVVSDYRSRGILKRYQVTPISPAMILLVQITVYTLYAITSLISLFLTATIFFGYSFQGNVICFFGGYFLVLASMFSIGILVGGLAPNTKMAGIFASVLYFPMLIFSGATLPYEAMPAALQQAADIMPLTQGIKLLKAASLGLEAERVMLSAMVMVAIAVICGSIAIYFFKWE